MFLFILTIEQTIGLFQELYHRGVMDLLQLQDCLDTITEVDLDRSYLCLGNRCFSLDGISLKNGFSEPFDSDTDLPEEKENILRDYVTKHNILASMRY
jgi:hypothetical protein